MKQIQRSIGNLLMVFALFLATYMYLILCDIQNMTAEVRLVMNKYNIYIFVLSVITIYCGLKLMKKTPVFLLVRKVAGVACIITGYVVLSGWLVNQQLGLIILKTNFVVLFGVIIISWWVGSKIKLNGRKPEITGQKMDELISIIKKTRSETDDFDHKKNTPVAVDFIKFSSSDDHCDLPMAIFSVYVTKKGESPNHKKYLGNLAYINGFKDDNHVICTLCHENHKVTKYYGDED